MNHRHIRIGPWLLCSPRLIGGNWHARARKINGPRHGNGTFAYRQVNTFLSSRREAEEWAINHWIPSLEEGPQVKPFQEAFEEFLSLRTGLRERSRKIYENHLKTAFSPVFGPRRVSEVDTSLVEKLFRDMELQGVASSTRAQRFKLLRTFFQWAQRRGITHRDPTAGLKAPKAIYQERQALTPQQMADLLRNIPGNVDGNFRGILLTALLTGLRRANLLGLRIRHLDFQRRAISFRPGEVKTGIALEIPISWELMEVLKDRVASLGTLNPDALVFGSISGVLETLSSAGIRAGIPGKITLHTLRHTYATWIADKVPYAVAQALLGHKARTITDRYTHLSFETLREWVDKLPRLLPEERKAAMG